ncbi:MAG: methyltransferase domain-containing protein [Myxococcales bacterium]|nr:methyltransferase domain-containing protein [Myxococcales bacterium]
MHQSARRLFTPIAPTYQRWATILSLGQDPRWRAEMVASMNLETSARVLDVAAGNGAIAQLLAARGCRVIALDQSREMLGPARQRGFTAVQAGAEWLPFDDDAFDALTLGYLLRYVADPAGCLRELVRVVRPGGMIGMVEFGRPRSAWGVLWWLYTRAVLPAAGTLLGSGWSAVGRFLGPSIDAFHRRYPDEAVDALWQSAGLSEVRHVRRSLGGGLIVWGRKA